MKNYIEVVLLDLAIILIVIEIHETEAIWGALGGICTGGKIIMIRKEEYPIKDNGFEYLDKYYNCQSAIKRDVKMILQEAEISHKDTFDELYDRSTLRPDKIRIFVDRDDVPIYGIIIYLIDYKEGNNSRCACGGYYPFWDGKLLPHPYQESICW